MHKTKLIHWCDVVQNLVVDFELLFVCLIVCASRFANFVRGKWSNHDSKNCSEIRAVALLEICFWKL